MRCLQLPLVSLTLLSMLATGNPAQAGPAKEMVPWMHDIPSALQAATENQKGVLIHFWTPDCLPCQRLETTTFNQPEFATALTRHFIPVKINARKNPRVAKRFGVDRWPTDVILTPDGKIVYRTISPRVPSHYIQMLNHLAQQRLLTASHPSRTTSRNLRSRRPSNSRSQIATASRTRLATPTTGYPLQARNPRDPEASYAETSRRGSTPPSPRSPASVRETVNTTSSRHAEDLVQLASHNSKSPQRDYSVEIINHFVSQPAQQESPPQRTVNSTTANSTTANSTTANSANVAHQRTVDRTRNSFASTPSQPQAKQQTALMISQPVPPLTSNVPTTATTSLDVLPEPEPQATPPASTVASSPALSAESPLLATRSANSANDSKPATIGPISTAPVMGLDGYCPVTLLEEAKWVPGDRKWGVRHRGRVYLFHSPEAQQKFLADPDRFSPAISGYDPVRFADENRYQAGSRRHGVVYEGRIFLFDSEASLTTFEEHPERYTESVRQAVRMADLMR